MNNQHHQNNMDLKSVLNNFSPVNINIFYDQSEHFPFKHVSIAHQTRYCRGINPYPANVENMVSS